MLNLIPGLPLDGGRVLKSAIWGVTGNVHRGTIIAGWCGRILAVLALLWPFYLSQFTDRRTGPCCKYVFAVIIAGFLWTGATAAMSSARIRRGLPSLVARSLVRTNDHRHGGHPSGRGRTPFGRGRSGQHRHGHDFGNAGRHRE